MDVGKPIEKLCPTALKTSPAMEDICDAEVMITTLSFAICKGD